MISMMQTTDETVEYIYNGTRNDTEIDKFWINIKSKAVQQIKHSSITHTPACYVIVTRFVDTGRRREPANI